MSEPADLTTKLQAFVAGRNDLAPELLDLIYARLQVLARYAVKGERRGHSLQPTALINEAWLKLQQQENLVLANRTHFYALAAKAMRRLLIDYARTRDADKRGGKMMPVTLSDAASGERPDPDLLDLNEQLDVLEQIAPRQYQILILRFFAGLTLDEIAAYYQLSPAMISKELLKARGWLFARLA